jgi:lysyl-tRNA synthetase class 2
MGNEAIESERVDSSVVISVGYDTARRVLKVRFRSGAVYYYLDVPSEIHRALMTAPSIGKFLNEVIKPRFEAVSEREAG